MRRALFAVALSAVTVVALPVSAHADAGGISVNTGHGWGHDSTAPLLDASRIAPGWSASYPLQVRNDTDGPATFTIGAADLIDLENGCTHAEAAVDSTCGANQGELGHALVFSVFVDPHDDGQFESQPAWTGTLYDIITPAAIAANVPADAVWGVRIDAQLPFASGNETQSDQVGFSLRLGLQGEGSADAVEVLGTKVTRQPGQPVLGSMANGLPFTGSFLQQMTAAALWLILAGCFALLVTRSRRGSLARRPSRRT